MYYMPYIYYIYHRLPSSPYACFHIRQAAAELQNKNTNGAVSSALKKVQSQKLLVVRLKAQITATKSAEGPDSYVVSALEAFTVPLDIAEKDLCKAERELTAMIINKMDGCHVEEKVKYLIGLAQKLVMLNNLVSQVEKNLKK